MFQQVSLDKNIIVITPGVTLFPSFKLIFLVIIIIVAKSMHDPDEF